MEVEARKVFSGVSLRGEKAVVQCNVYLIPTTSRVLALASISRGAWLVTGLDSVAQGLGTTLRISRLMFVVRFGSLRLMAVVPGQSGEISTSAEV